MNSETTAFSTGIIAGIVLSLLILSSIFKFSNSDLLEAKLAEYNKTTGALELIDIKKTESLNNDE